MPLPGASLEAAACNACAAIWLPAASVARVEAMHDDIETRDLAQRAWAAAQRASEPGLPDAVCGECGAPLAWRLLWEQPIRECEPHGAFVDSIALMEMRPQLPAAPISAAEDAPQPPIVLALLESIAASATAPEPAASKGRRSFRSLNRRFVISALVATAALVVAGMIGDVRAFFHSALLTLLGAAFLPFVVIGGILVPVLAVPLVLAAIAQTEVPGMDAAAELGGHAVKPFARGYYGLLARVRRPVFWGVFIGAGLGILLLWIWIGLVIVPGESRTLERLHELEGRLRAQRVSPAKLRARAAGGISERSLRIGPSDEALADGFGRPLRLEKGWTGAWIRSLGYDGELGTADDLCLKIDAKWLRALKDAGFELLRQYGVRSAEEIYQAVKGARCR